MSLWFYWQVDINDKWWQNNGTILLVTKIPTFWFASKYVCYLLPCKMTDEFPVCNAWYWRSSINWIVLWIKQLTPTTKSPLNSKCGTIELSPSSTHSKFAIGSFEQNKLYHLSPSMSFCHLNTAVIWPKYCWYGVKH